MFRPFWIAHIDGMKILFIGIITEEVLAATKNDELIGSFVDIGEAAREVGNICNAYNAIDIDFTVLLTHIGFEEDKKLAALLDPDWGVDVIIGGHSHTKLEEPAKVNDIYIVQAGTGTDEIGRFDIMVDTDLNAIDTFTWRMVPIDDMHCPRDEELERFIQHYKSVTSEKYDRIITRFSCELTHPKRNQETALGDLIADILRDSFGIDLMLMGSGAIRSYSLGPVVHYADLVECLPYDDAVYAQGHRHPARADDPPYPAGRGFPGGAHGVLPVFPRNAHRLVEERAGVSRADAGRRGAARRSALFRGDAEVSLQ